MRKKAAALTALTLVGALTACGGNRLGDGDASAGGDSVAAGASKEEYRAALEDMDPVTMKIQAPGSKGSPNAAYTEDYVAAVEDWSGGKINFEIVYGYAIAAPADANDAVGDGRLSMNQLYGVYDPSRYPATSALIDAMTAGTDTRGAGDLQALAAVAQVGFETPDVAEEFEERGIHLLFPMIAYSNVDLMCIEPADGLADLAGRQVGVPGALQASYAESLGMTPVSMPGSEAFEAIERGVIDCSMTSMGAARLYGFLDKAKFILHNPTNPLGRNPIGVGVNAVTWSQLPLAAQQLLFDRMDVFLEGIVRLVWDEQAALYRQVLDDGGSYTDFDAEARDVIAGTSEQYVADAGEKWELSNAAQFETLVDESVADWDSTLSELGYEPSSLAEFADAGGGEDIDLEPFLEALRTDLLNNYRPGA